MNRKSENEICKQGDLITEIQVSICCFVYNHELFLRECLEGFVIQQTSFSFEILVHDDASTDHSADIIREYTARYPHLFKPIYQTENQYSKGVDVFSLNVARSKGKYIAMCEGDDYWTDPLKLQKQVDFLESHEEYVLSFHDATVVDEDGNIIAESKISKSLTTEMLRDWTSLELMKGITPPTPTVVYRQKYYDKVLDIRKKGKRLINGDKINTSLIGVYGKGKFHSDIENSICTIHKGCIWQKKPAWFKNESEYKTYTFLYKVHKRNKMVRGNILNTRYYYVRAILQYYIKENCKKKMIIYYLHALQVLFSMFSLKNIYVFHKDIAYWIRNRNSI